MTSFVSRAGVKKRLSLSIPLEPFNLSEHVAIAREAEQLGYDDVWSFEVDGFDCFSPLAVVALATQQRLGTAIANVFTRGPATLAQCAAAIADLAPGRFVLGLGSASPPIVETWNGGHFDKPATRVRETVQVVREALDGGRVVFHGETISVDGFRLSRPPAAAVPLHVAALRPGMLRVAGEVADGCIINMLSADDVTKSVTEIREAARAATRNPDTIEITARLVVNIDAPSQASETRLRKLLAGYLTVPVYRAFHEWLGRGEILKPMWDAWDAGDRRAALAAVPHSVLHDLIIQGSAEERNAHVRRYLDAGVDTAFLSWTTFEADRDRRREMLLQAMREMAPAVHDSGGSR